MKDKQMKQSIMREMLNEAAKKNDEALKKTVKDAAKKIAKKYTEARILGIVEPEDESNDKDMLVDIVNGAEDNETFLTEFFGGDKKALKNFIKNEELIQIFIAEVFATWNKNEQMKQIWILPAEAKDYNSVDEWIDVLRGKAPSKDTEEDVDAEDTEEDTESNSDDEKTDDDGEETDLEESDEPMSEDDFFNGPTTEPISEPAPEQAPAPVVAPATPIVTQPAVQAEKPDPEYKPNTVGAVIEILKKSDPNDELMFRLNPEREECFMFDVSRHLSMNDHQSITYIDIARGKAQIN